MGKKKHKPVKPQIVCMASVASHHFLIAQIYREMTHGVTSRFPHTLCFTAPYTLKYIPRWANTE